MKTKFYHTKRLYFISQIIFVCTVISCGEDDSTFSDTEDASDQNIVSVVPSYFYADGSLTITTVDCTLSDGTETECYQITTASIAEDHQMGPWCPDTISDDADAGGIWLEDGEVYNVDGDFIKNLATFYNDTTWLMYDENGDIYITQTEDDCINAANPNVGDEYENFCVECIPDYIDVSQTWLLPINPVYQSSATYFSTAGGISNVPSTRGIALNGIELSAPAPVSNILSAYTIAPFDDAGGHINVSQGYHYHANTGMGTKIAQEDGHADLIGYALDGYGMYELLDAEGNEPADLDDLRGHYDETRGYHYHIDETGDNNFINGLRGAYAVN